MSTRCKACNHELEDYLFDDTYELCNECYKYVLDDLHCNDPDEGKE